jgi:hypothetical protein
VVAIPKTVTYTPKFPMRITIMENILIEKTLTVGSEIFCDRPFKIQRTKEKISQVCGCKHR